MSVSVFDLMRQHRLNPKRSLSQNFLVDEKHLDHIIKIAELSASDTILEIGPGLGVLTERLANQAKQVYSIELDERLLGVLKKRFADRDNVTLIHNDILQVDIASLLTSHEATASQDTITPTPAISPAATVVSQYKVVANLPYHITSSALRHVLESTYRPELIVVMVQKEVAERICAAPGKMSILAVSVQFYAKPTLVHHVPAGAFHPQPKVDSAVLHLETLPRPAVPDIDPKRFFRVVRAGFGQKRKQLLNSLSAGLHRPKEEIHLALTDADIEPRRRAETLSLEEWGILCKTIEQADTQKNSAPS